MNLHNITGHISEIIFWVAPGGRHRPCRYPDEPVRNHHACPSDRTLRHNVIYCECPSCSDTGFAHYIDNRRRIVPETGRYYDHFYCMACNEGDCPLMPRLDSEGYPV
jgi:hypothetical protein